MGGRGGEGVKERRLGAWCFIVFQEIIAVLISKALLCRCFVVISECDPQLVAKGVIVGEGIMEQRYDYCYYCSIGRL